MTTLWVLVANSSNAKIFQVKGKGREINKLHDLDFPDGRKKGAELLTDRPGRSFDRFGEGRHAMGKEEKVHEHEQQIFAHQIKDILKKGVEEKEFDEIAIISSPQFLGELRQVIPDQVKKCITNEVDKDIVNSSSEKECIDSLCKYLDLWNR